MGDRMCFKINQKHILKLRLLLFPPFILILFACATVPTKTYEETVSQWRSYKDVDKWMRSHYLYDLKRRKAVAGKTAMPTPQSPEETFKRKSGVCFDTAYFLKDVLNRIDPSYEAKVVKVEVSPFPTFKHDFVCPFKKEGKFFIMMHYGQMDNLVGVHGPFNSLDEFKTYYESIHPRVKEGLKVVQVTYRE